MNVLYCVFCNVDNGCRHEKYEMYINAPSEKFAIQAAEKYWNSQYDTTAKVTSVEQVPVKEYGIVCMKEVY